MCFREKRGRGTIGIVRGKMNGDKIEEGRKEGRKKVAAKINK